MSTYRRKRAEDGPEISPRRSATYTTLLTSLVIVLVSVFAGISLLGRVSQLETRVATIQAEVNALSDIELRIEQIHARLAEVDKEVQGLSRAREDILSAICDVLGKPVARCGL